MKCSVFWDITPLIPSKVNHCFGGTCRVHLQVLIISQAINYHKEYIELSRYCDWLRAGHLGNWYSIPGKGKRFVSSPQRQTGSGAHPASYIMGTGDSIPGVKRHGREDDLFHVAPGLRMREAILALPR
jgi:hypothetical protein